MQDVPTQYNTVPAKRDASQSHSQPHSQSHSQPGAGLLFLREEELRSAQDRLFFALRDLNQAADKMLLALGLGRAHHRTLHWIGRRPGLNVGELLGILGITKQSLTRVLGPLIREGYVAQAPGLRDRRQRLLRLTEAGAKLEARLFETQRERLLAAYREAGGPAVEGFRRVLHGLTKEQGRKYFDQLDSKNAVRPPRSPG